MPPSGSDKEDTLADSSTCQNKPQKEIKSIISLYLQLSTDKKDAIDDGFPSIRWHQTADFGFVPNPRMQKTFMAVALDLPDETSPYGT